MKSLTFFGLLFILLSFSLFSYGVLAQSSSVLTVEVTDTIDQSTVEMIKGALDYGDFINVEMIVLLLDTPGGGFQQTRDIADIIHQSDIPFVGYVYPSGATAWSAGTFILLSSHVAVMADHTVIGSCQPVIISFEGTKTVNDSKTINALVEWIQERARLYGRNETYARECITLNRNLNASLAVEYGVVEYSVGSLEDLLLVLDNVSISTSSGNVTLNTMDADIVVYRPSFSVQLMKIISNPLLTSLLFMLGIFALFFGLSSPGVGAEVFGVIAILLALIGSGFAISTVSIIFLIMGCLLLIIELFVTPGFGIVGIGGMICLVIGTIFLVPSYSPPTTEWMISMEWINDVITILLIAAVLIAIFFVFLLYKIIEIRGRKKAVGVFIGEKAITIDRLTPDTEGFIRFKGEYWKAKADTIIEPNTPVIIVSKDESILYVKQKNGVTKH
jgi:membrane-bound serine protease (ClpP class)